MQAREHAKRASYVLSEVEKGNPRDDPRAVELAQAHALTAIALTHTFEVPREREQQQQ